MMTCQQLPDCTGSIPSHVRRADVLSAGAVELLRGCADRAEEGLEQPLGQRDVVGVHALVLALRSIEAVLGERDAVLVNPLQRGTVVLSGDALRGGGQSGAAQWWRTFESGPAKAGDSTYSRVARRVLRPSPPFFFFFRCVPGCSPGAAYAAVWSVDGAHPIRPASAAVMPALTIA